MALEVYFRREERCQLTTVSILKTRKEVQVKAKISRNKDQSGNQ